MIRIRVNFVGGVIEDDPLALSATTMTSQALAALPPIEAGKEYISIILDPDGVNGEPEIVWVTEHEFLSQTATIEREKENTTAREHNCDTYWVHAPTAFDWDHLIINTDNPALPGRVFLGSTMPSEVGFELRDGDVWIRVDANE